MKDPILNKPPDALKDYKKKMEKLVFDQQRVATAIHRAVVDARKQANFLRMSIPRLSLADADRYLKENPPSALALTILMRESRSTDSAKGGQERASRYTDARLFVEEYWREHRETILAEGKEYHAGPLAGRISTCRKYPCKIRPSTVLRWWRDLES